MAKLYELSDAYKALQDTDELTEEELITAIGNIKDIFREKAINIGKLVLSMKADADAIDVELKRLNDRKQAIENRGKGLKFYLAQEMGVVQMDKIQSELLTISLRNSPPSVNVLDESAIPNDYWRIIPEQRQVDKQAILTTFKENGQVVSGVEVVSDKKYIVIR